MALVSRSDLFYGRVAEPGIPHHHLHHVVREKIENGVDCVFTVLRLSHCVCMKPLNGQGFLVNTIAQTQCKQSLHIDAALHDALDMLSPFVDRIPIANKFRYTTGRPEKCADWVMFAFYWRKLKVDWSGRARLPLPTGNPSPQLELDNSLPRSLDLH